jgi:hypothetical protein
MDDLEYLPILKRVGTVLVVVGLLDIGVMVYCIAHDISYSSSFSIFALVAGVCLIRGSLRVAGAVLFFATLYLAGFCCLLVAWPIFFPLGLALTQVRLYPQWCAAFSIFLIAVSALLYWVVKQLRREPVSAALAATGRNIRSERGAVFAAVGLIAILGFFSTWTSNCGRAQRAKSVAAAKIGPGYNYHVTSIHFGMGRGGSDASAEVTAWNDREIRQMVVHWKE